MDMWKKMIIMICVIAIIIVGIVLFSISRNSEKINENTNKIIENQTELSSEYVTDDCLNEWSDYRISVQEELQETSQNLNDENRHYILRAEDNLIHVYYINEEEEEVLYRVTEISTKYLTEEDVKKLETGIDVYGVQALNQLLEDFE